VNAEHEIKRLLKESGAVLKRDAVHVIWELPDGQKFTMGKTPSDRNAADNALSTLRRMLGQTGHDGRGQEGRRRAYRPKHRQPAQRLKLDPTPPCAMSLANQIAYLSTLEELRRARAELVEVKRHYAVASAENERLCEENARLERKKCSCLWCGFISLIRV
jgi:hypothetical protein